MGQYNPHLPEVLGTEWVAIRDEDVIFSPAVNVEERGYRFSNSATRTLVDGRFYLKDVPSGPSQGQVYTMAVYPAGAADQSGPVRRCIIPVNAVQVTGTFSVAPTPAILAGTSDQHAQVVVNATTGSKRCALFFATNQFTQLLGGKRILAVNLLHALSWNPVDGNSLTVAERFGESSFESYIKMMTGGGGTTGVRFTPTPYVQFSGITGYSIPGLLTVGEDIVQEGLYGSTRVSRIRLGEVNWLWDNPSTQQTQQIMPWRFEELLRFEQSAGTNRTWIQYEFGGSVRWLGEYWFNYAALEVIFCEERRLIVGGRQDGANAFFLNPGGQSPYDVSTQVIPLRNTTTYAVNPSLPVGDYDVVVACADVGDVQGIFEYPATQLATDNPYPILQGLRQLDDIVTHQGVHVGVTQTEGDVFTVEAADVIPQLTLHESGGVVADVHPYGRLARAQVWGSVTASQDIFLSGMAITGSYPQVRYYARRFGDTTVPLRVERSATPTTFVEITPTAFDELDEIIDGWREVTLTLASPPSLFSATLVSFTWSAAGELPGNRWEVLGLVAPAVSGTPQSPFQQVVASQRLGAATYGGTGATSWWMPQYAPPVSGQMPDSSTDLVLILAQDPPTITGLAVSGTSQGLTTYTECSHGTCCAPTALGYHRVTWSMGDGVGFVDTASREVTGGLGTSDSGGTYTTAGGSASDYSVTGGKIRIALPGATLAQRAAYVTGSNYGDVDQYVTVAPSALATGDSLAAYVQARFNSGSNNGYRFAVEFDDDNTVDIAIRRVTGGAETTLVSGGNVFPSYVAQVGINVRAQAVGTTLRMKVWLASAPEPSAWTLTTTDATYTAGLVGLRALRFSSNTNATGYVLFDDYFVNPFLDTMNLGSFGYYELQRSDAVDDWKTIMRATSMGRTWFNDYEARVGTASSYRIRVVNALGFAGPWSATVSNTLTSPGVTLPTCGSSKRGVLIFTSNEVQDGTANLAYAMAWAGDSSVEETFSFVEAGGVQIQSMFDRDYQVAFHGTERGGEAFSRDLLLANAAVALPRLANATSLRNLAWQDLPYVCVRDDLGDRWLATVIVPSDSVRRNRRLYLASVSVIEVTNTPSPVDP